MPEAVNGGGCEQFLLQFLWLWAPLGSALLRPEQEEFTVQSSLKSLSWQTGNLFS